MTKALSLLTFALQGYNTHFSGRWCSTNKGIPRGSCKGLNSLIILVAWELWKYRNACVFEGARPSIEVLHQSVANE
ncbi:hypothetical protein BDA96_09G011000 [Sorghum bicolor]|uniref:Uncharacterized protein n=2 Tax=Sorghum bicolor TaxID=4558 RepID=A0A921QAB5_SORBI|nr:hypothetical protein BDA96_09G011000 [Sorghum bicolor]OQU77219.1 hypothetical protein SORBI_3009G011050 [Sorghum bicolor]